MTYHRLRGLKQQISHLTVLQVTFNMGLTGLVVEALMFWLQELRME